MGLVQGEGNSFSGIDASLLQYAYSLNSRDNHRTANHSITDTHTAISRIISKNRAYIRRFKSSGISLKSGIPQEGTRAFDTPRT